MTLIWRFWNDEQGQDSISNTSYSWALVALISAALFIGAGGSVSGIWNTSNLQLIAATTAAG